MMKPFAAPYALKARASSLHRHALTMMSCSRSTLSKHSPKVTWMMQIYVEQPHGLADPKYAACRLLKPLEGTCQAGNLFMKSNAAQLAKLGYSRSMTDPNVFWRTCDGMTIKIGIYVDNLIIAYPKAAGKLVAEFIAGYKSRFNIEERGEPSIFMGLQVERNRKAKTSFFHFSELGNSVELSVEFMGL